MAIVLPNSTSGVSTTTKKRQPPASMRRDAGIPPRPPPPSAVKANKKAKTKALVAAIAAGATLNEARSLASSHVTKSTLSIVAEEQEQAHAPAPDAASRSSRQMERPSPVAQVTNAMEDVSSSNASVSSGSAQRASRSRSARRASSKITATPMPNLGTTTDEQCGTEVPEWLNGHVLGQQEENDVRRLAPSSGKVGGEEDAVMEGMDDDAQSNDTTCSPGLDEEDPAYEGEVDNGDGQDAADEEGDVICEGGDATYEGLVATHRGEEDLQSWSHRSWDWRELHTYDGQRQPPIGKRLQHALNYLAEEDVDRDARFHDRVKEIECYLDWLEAEHGQAAEGGKGRLSAASREMISLARDRIATHRLFEQHHYDTERRLLDVATLKAPSADTAQVPRMPVVEDRGVHIYRAHGSIDASGPRARLCPREPQMVNPLPYMNLELRPCWNRFIADEAALWAAKPADMAPPQPNLALHEAAEFDYAVENGRGAVLQDLALVATAVMAPTTTTTTTTSGAGPLTTAQRAWAARRATHRAGLQAALRRFNSAENRAVATPWRQVALPVDAAALHDAQNTVAAHAWPIPRLARSAMPAQLDNMPYTYWSQAVLHRRRRAAAEARAELLQLGPAEKGYCVDIALPAGLGAPLAPPHGGTAALPAVVQYESDLQHACCVAADRLLRAQRKAPRELLTTVLRWIDPAAVAALPAELEFRADDFEKQAGRNTQRPRLLNLDEVAMLSHLAESSHPRAVFAVPPPEEKGEVGEEKFALYRIFALRLQKLLEDPSPECVFPELDTRVRLEDLLTVMNAGTDGPVKRTRFTPFEALKWLDRLNTKGRIRFYPDLACYGWVSRPIPDHHPEHQIVWPAGANETPRYPRDLVTWQQVSERGGAQPPDPRLADFLCVVAWRLAFTLKHLSAQRKQRLNTTPVRADRVRAALTAWQAASNDKAALPLDNSSDDADASALPLAIYIVRKAEPTLSAEAVAALTPASAARRIHAHILREGHANEVMLAPGRPAAAAAATAHGSLLVRDVHWGWAGAGVRGAKRAAFFGLDRWPVHVQTAGTRAAIAARAAADARLDWDPAAHFPLSPRWTAVQRLRPYRRERREFRAVPGGAAFWMGDTRLQQAVVEARLTKTLAREIGIDPDRAAADVDSEIARLMGDRKEHPGWAQRLTSMFKPSNQTAAAQFRGSFLPLINEKYMYTPRSQDSEMQKDGTSPRHVGLRAQ